MTQNNQTVSFKGFATAAAPAVVAAVILLTLALNQARPQVPPLPRGDVAIDAAVAASLAAGKGFWIPWERASLYRPPTESDRFGFPADQHPPLWPLAGAFLIRFMDMHPPQAMEWASFICHLVVLLLMARVGQRLGLGRLAFLPALAFAVSSAGSAFSFNGSLYAAQAALYLAAAMLMGRKELSLPAALGLGLVMGAAYLVNYQAVVLVPAFAVFSLWHQGRRGFSPRNLARAGLVLLAFLGVVLPWWLRNLELFGSPTYSVNPFYLLAKAGAVAYHERLDGSLIFHLKSLPPLALAKSLCLFALQNTPFLLLLVLILFPGCLVFATAPGRNLVRTYGNNPLLSALAVILLAHLGTSLVWPGLKLRYLIPAGPPLLLMAWHVALNLDRVRRRWVLVLALLLGLACGAVWLKGGRHGEALCIAFLTGHLAPGLVLCLHRSRVLPGLALGALALAAVGVLPGDAYFNLAPQGDFFGEDKDALETVRARDLVRISQWLKKRSAHCVLGDLRLWSVDPGLKVVTLPHEAEGESFAENLETTALDRSIRYAVLPRDLFAATAGLTPVYETNEWVVVALNREMVRPPQ